MRTYSVGKSAWCIDLDHGDCPYDGTRDPESIGCECACHNVPLTITTDAEGFITAIDEGDHA